MRATYVAKPKDQPAGINMEDFVMHDATANQRQQEDVDSKRLVEIINEVSQHHTTLIGVISRRADQVKVIINWWNKGDVTSAINALSMQNDLSVSMDVLNVTFA